MSDEVDCCCIAMKCEFSLQTRRGSEAWTVNWPAGWNGSRTRWQTMTLSHPQSMTSMSSSEVILTYI